MTGVFIYEKKLQGHHIGKAKYIEELSEIIDDLYEWWQSAHSGDEITITCDLPV